MRLKKETICIYDTEYVNQFCKYSGSIVKCTLTCIRHPSVWVLRSLSIFKLTHTHIRGSFGGVLRMRYSAGIMFHQTPLKAGFISESCLS